MDDLFFKKIIKSCYQYFYLSHCCRRRCRRRCIPRFILYKSKNVSSWTTLAAGAQPQRIAQAQHSKM